MPTISDACQDPAFMLKGQGRSVLNHLILQPFPVVFNKQNVAAGFLKKFHLNNFELRDQCF